MVIVSIKVDGKTTPMYMDGGLHEEIQKRVKPRVQKKDFDFLFAVDGEEGSGKSVFAMQLAKIMDPDFTLDQITFTPQEFTDAIVNAKPHQCIVYDEGYVGLSSRGALSEMNQLLVSLMMEMRQRNLFVIIVMPTVFMLDRYVALHRARCLFHIYLNQDGNRGFWTLYNKKRLKMLYLNGKKFFDYHCQKAGSYGKFTEVYTVNEQDYRDKKRRSLRKKEIKTTKDQYKWQRDVLLYYMVKEVGLSRIQISRACKKYNFDLTRSGIGYAIKSKEKELSKFSSPPTESEAQTPKESIFRRNGVDNEGKGGDII